MINSVRNTVQSLLNKNNYGYISPADFNLYAKQAQMEIFEEYFSMYNKVMNMENARMAGTDYADLSKTVAEAIEYFMRTDFLLPSPTPTNYIVNKFFAPAVSNVGYDYFSINRILCYTTVIVQSKATGISAGQLEDINVDFVALGVSVGDIVVNIDTYEQAEAMKITATKLDLSEDIFLAANNYIIYKASSAADAEKVTVGKITMLNNSLLTAPSNVFPVYTLDTQGVITIYPNNIKNYGAVSATYFRYPVDPKWTYVTLSSGEPMFDQSQPDYADFELPLEDEYKLITKILQYCGLTIREGEVVQYALGQEQMQGNNS